MNNIIYNIGDTIDYIAETSIVQNILEFILWMCSDRTILCIYSDIVIGTGIVDCTRSRSQTVVRGHLATSCCRRERLPPDGWWPLAVAGGVRQLGVYS